MLRVRIDGGALSVEQLRVLGQISSEFARDTADITDRQNLQFHWIRVEDMPEIWRRIEGVGLSTTEACGDTPRVILGSPVAGISAQEEIDGSTAIEEINRRYIGDPAVSNLPRKFKTAISLAARTPRQRSTTCRSSASVHPEHGPGFDLLGGRRALHQPTPGRPGSAPGCRSRTSPRCGSASSGSSVTTATAGCGNRARLKFLVADWGAETFRHVLETEYLQPAAGRRPAGRGPATSRSTTSGCTSSATATATSGFAPIAGRVSGTTLTARRRLRPSAAGSARVRLTPYQKLVVLDVPEPAVESLISSVAELGPARPAVEPGAAASWPAPGSSSASSRSSRPRSGPPTSSTNSSSDSATSRSSAPVSIHLNGCPNSCARIQVADIGLKGQIVTDAEGRQVAGYQVHLGGGLGLDAGFGRKLRAHKVTSDELGDYVERVVRTYAGGRERGRAVRPMGGPGGRGGAPMTIFR